jgi:hypothetical protein
LAEPGFVRRVGDRRLYRGLIVPEAGQPVDVVLQVLIAVRMGVAGFALESQENNDGAPQQRFRFQGAASGAEEVAKVGEARRNGWMIRAKMRLVQRERADVQRFRAGISCLVAEQRCRIVHQQLRRSGNAGPVRGLGYRLGMRCERLQPRPDAPIVRIGGTGLVDPCPLQTVRAGGASLDPGTAAAT